jgi:serine protease Do
MCKEKLMKLDLQRPAENRSEGSETVSASSNKPMIAVQITGLRLTACLLFVLLIGIGAGTLISYRAGAEPNRLYQSGMRVDSASPMALSVAFNASASAVEPSVVHITTLDVDGEGEAYNQSSGSGIIIDPAGYIITNNHVVKEAKKIKVRLEDGSILSGVAVGADEETDLAVVKVVTSKPLKAARIGNSDKVMVGEWVLAIGSPFGLEQTVTAGIISAKERVTDSRRSFQQLLQTDAAINPGNSGGPLVNMAGEVIGLNSQIATRTGNFQGVGFAVPSAIFIDVYNQLLSHGRVSRGYMGIYPDKVTPQFAEIYNMSEVAGAIIHDITDLKGPAAISGIKSGDVIVEFDGYKIKDDRDLVRRIVATQVKKPVSVKLLRNGSLQSVSVTLIEREPTIAQAPPRDIPDAKPKSDRAKPEKKEDKNENLGSKLGLSLAPMTEMRAQQAGYKTTTGIILRTVETDSVAYDAGLRDGDIIKEINKQPIDNQENFEQAISKLRSGDPIVFFVEQRRSRSSASHRFISLTVP